MFKNNFRITLRNFRNNKIFSFINISGLAIGLACFFLIIFYVLNETSYDSFHKNFDRIYRFNLIGKLGNNEFILAGSSPPLAQALVTEFPEIEKTTRLHGLSTVHIKHKGELLEEKYFYYADSTFLSIFSFNLTAGDRLSVLNSPNSIIVTSEIAEKLFNDENPIGKTIELYDGSKFNITGILEAPPANSHLKMNFVASMQNWERANVPDWFTNDCYTYALLKNNTDVNLLQDKMGALVKKNLDPMIQAAMGITYDQFVAGGNEFKYDVQPLSDIHLNTNYYQEPTPTRDKSTIFIFLFVGVLILAIASVNFINLSSARSIKRANEVGVRKVLGSNRAQLIRQFVFESIFTTSISLVIAIVITELALPGFENLSGTELNVSLVSNWYYIPLIILFSLFVGVLSGIFPALQLSSFQPIAILRGRLYKGKKSGRMRSALVVFQFSISIILFIGTLVVKSQIDYLGEKKLGYRNKNMFVIENVNRLEQQKQSLKNEVLRIANINNATYSSGLPISALSASIFKVPGEGGLKNQTLVNLNVDNEFFDVYELELKRGRFLSDKYGADSLSVLINEAAARVLGFNDPIGETIYAFGDDGKDIPITIVGILKDFHLESLHRKIRPMLISMIAQEDSRFLSIALSGVNINETINRIESIWKSLVPEEPFEYFFMDESFDAIYHAELQTGRIFLTFSALAIFIACLGLFGLASFSAEQRTKEIGIRKVHGASITNIILMLSKDFSILIIVSSIIACPIAYYLMNNWLQNFAFRINLGAGVFLFACGLAFIIALVTVGYQAFKAANSNPVNSLRYE